MPGGRSGQPCCVMPMMTHVRRLQNLSAAAWIAIVGWVASVVIFGWSLSRGLEMSADEGAHFLETARPWDCGFFHTLYPWYAHVAWKAAGASIVRMRWLALVAQMAVTAASVFAVRGWLGRAGWRRLPPIQVLLPLAMTWSLVCYTLGSITVTYTSLSCWLSTLWLALVLHVDNRERTPALWVVALVWVLALLDCTAKASTGAFLLTGSLLLTLGWRLESFRLVRRLHLAAAGGLVAVSALIISNLAGLGGGGPNAWDLTTKTSPLANFFSWAARYLASDALRNAVLTLWKEPVREMAAAASFYSCTLAAAAGFAVANLMSRFFEGRRFSLWIAGGIVGCMIAYISGGVVVADHLAAGTRTVVIAFISMFVLVVWNRDEKARVAALLGVLIVQLLYDAVGIVTPGQTYFWAADHEFRLIFLLLISAFALWRLVPDPGRSSQAGEVSSVNGPLIWCFLLAMPVIGWFGSGCSLGARAGYQYGIWTVLIAVFVSAAGQESDSRRNLMTASLLMTLLAVNAVCVTRALRPINAGFPTFSQETREISVGPRGETLVFERKTAGFISRVKSDLKENGFRKGAPVLAFYDFPGLVFLVGGISPGSSWYFTPNNYEHATGQVQVQAFNEQRLRDVPDEMLRRAFILQTDGETSFVEILARRGVRFPDDYERCSTLKIPAGVNSKRTLDIWKPKPATAAAK